MKRIAATSLCLCLAACGAQSGDRGAGNEPPPPSLVVVTIDSLGAEHLAFHGYFRSTTPNLDRFAAEEAVFFDRAYTPIATSLPAHAALWTGRHPVASGILSGGVTVAAREGVQAPLFLAEELSRQGYDTAAFLGSASIGGASGLTSGFAYVDQPDGAQPVRVRRAYLTTNNALAWLADRAGDAPLLLWVHYADPRSPYDPPPEHRAPFQGGPELTEYLERTGFADPRAGSVRKDHDGYDGELHYVDAQVGRLLEGVAAHLPRERTAVVITSPHGEGLGQHGERGHGRLYEEQVHVPLLLKLPGVAGGRRSGTLVSLLDVLPTLEHALSLDLDGGFRSGFDGEDALAEPSARSELVLVRTVEEQRRWGKGVKVCLLRGRWKLHAASDRKPRLFDLGGDPGETLNLLGGQPVLERRLLGQLHAEIARMSATESPFVVRPELSEEALEGLRDLGFAR